ncbi:MAG: extracellular solute-binding protein, partial [Chloroflexi bacterium]|nr:extracellular solute-binding protein [Chloroflexota bacterium]
MRFRYLLLVVLCLALLVACQGGETTTTSEPQATAEPQPDPQPEPEADPEPETAGPGADGELVVYSGRSESLVQPIIDRFEEGTGIEVEVRYAGTAELAATLLEEGANSPADVFYAQDPGGLGAVEAAGLLAPVPAELLAQVPARFASPDGQWVGISGRARVVVYHTELVSQEELPDDMEGFTDPQWQGRIGWAPTNGSFQAMVTTMRAVWGEERTRAWLEGIQANEPVAYEYTDVLSRKLSDKRWQDLKPVLGTLLSRAELTIVYFTWRPSSPDPA